MTITWIFFVALCALVAYYAYRIAKLDRHPEDSANAEKLLPKLMISWMAAEASSLILTALYLMRDLDSTSMWPTWPIFVPATVGLMFIGVGWGSHRRKSCDRCA